MKRKNERLLLVLACLALPADIILTAAYATAEKNKTSLVMALGILIGLACMFIINKLHFARLDKREEKK
jgi:hypothetical protein